MAKEKVKKVVESNDYFYEVIGFTIIILSFVTLGQLGRLGIILSLVLKFLIGDFAFLVLLILLFVGIRSIIKKKLIDTHSLTFLGFTILLLGICLFSHLAIYKELNLKNTQVITGTFNLYRSYFTYYDSTYITGGGMIGALLFQIIIFLLGEIGIIIMALVLIILGISSLFNTSIIDIVVNGKKVSFFIRKILKSIGAYFSKVDYKRYKKEKKFDKEPNLSLSLLSDIAPSVNKDLQAEINNEVVENLKHYIKQNNMFCHYTQVFTSYSCSRYKLELLSEQGFKNLREKINYFFDGKCFILKNNIEINIEVYNTFRELLTLKKVLSDSEKLSLPLGIEVDNSIIDINFTQDKVLLLCGEYNSGVRSCIKNIVVTILLKQNKEVNFEILDSKQEFRELGNLSDIINYYLTDAEGLSLLEKLSIEYERRKELFNFLTVDDINEANREIKASHPKINMVKPIYVIINTNLSKSNLDMENKLNYLLKFSFKMGIYFIIATRKKEDLTKLNITQATYISFFTSDLEFSLRTTNSDIACMLQTKGDFLFIQQNKIRHGQTPYLSSTDYTNILKRII